MPQEFQVEISGFEILSVQNAVIPWEFEGEFGGFKIPNPQNSVFHCEFGRGTRGFQITHAWKAVIPGDFGRGAGGLSIPGAWNVAIPWHFCGIFDSLQGILNSQHPDCHYSMGVWETSCSIQDCPTTSTTLFHGKLGGGWKIRNS